MTSFSERDREELWKPLACQPTRFAFEFGGRRYDVGAKLRVGACLGDAHGMHLGCTRGFAHARWNAQPVSIALTCPLLNAIAVLCDRHLDPV